MAVGYGEDLRDNLVPVTQESSLPEYREAQNSLTRQQPLPIVRSSLCLCQRTPLGLQHPSSSLTPNSLVGTQSTPLLYFLHCLKLLLVPVPRRQ